MGDSLHELLEQIVSAGLALQNYKIVYHIY